MNRTPTPACNLNIKRFSKEQITKYFYVLKLAMKLTNRAISKLPQKEIIPTSSQSTHREIAKLKCGHISTLQNRHVKTQLKDSV